MRLANQGHEAQRLIHPVGDGQAVGGNRQNVHMGVGTHRRLDRPVGSFLDPSQSDQRKRPYGQHAEHQGVEGAEMARMVRRPDRRLGVARLAMDEPQRVVPQGEIRAEIHGAPQFRERRLLAPAQP
ncbi:hypothetical protein D3C78_1416810 [compost metagenome]